MRNNLIQLLSEGKIPDIIGTTKTSEHPDAKLKFRFVHPDENRRDLSTVIDTYSEAIRIFNLNKDLGDIQLYVCLVNKNYDKDTTAIDEELIGSFWNEENEVS